MYDDIDFVITWVDGNDRQWINERILYSNKFYGDSREVRYRDWELLKYWFRGIEKFAPWVRKIHFITCGHLPNWLNTDHRKLNIVKHEDYILKEYLPTFNSNTIELNIHRISGLAEHFVYFNDDVLVLQKLLPSDFFIGGIPCDAAVLGLVRPLNDDIYNIIFNNLKILNKYFDKKSFIKENYGKIFNYSYGGYLIRNILLTPFKVHTGFYDFHLSNAFTKNTFYKLWDLEQQKLHDTCLNKFRSKNDVNQWLFRYWQLAEGNFIVHKVMGQYFEIGDPKLIKFILKQKNKLVCCNDVKENIDFVYFKALLLDSLEKIFDKKSDFEK